MNVEREKRERRIGRVVEISKRCWLSADDGGRYELNKVEGGWQIVDYATGEARTMTDAEARQRSAEACSMWNPASA